MLLMIQFIPFYAIRGAPPHILSTFLLVSTFACVALSAFNSISRSKNMWVMYTNDLQAVYPGSPSV